MATKSYDRVGLFDRIHKNIHKPIFEPPVDQELKEKFVWHIKKTKTSGEIKPSREQFFSNISKKKLHEISRSVHSKNEGRGSPEVLLKIDRQSVKSGGGSSKHTINYADYIGRDGTVDVKTSEGFILDDVESLKEYVNDFVDEQDSLKGLRAEEERTAVNVILSMNSEYVSDVDSFKEAVEDFVQKNAIDKGHRCFWAFHEDTKNPHAHLTVGYRSEDGKRFDHNKQGLNELRESFAEKLQGRGIEATATPRWIRGEIDKSISQDKYHHLLNKGLKHKDFDNLAKEHVNYTLALNQKTKEYRVITRPNQKAQEQYFKKRNECLIDFSKQLAKKASEAGNIEIAKELYTYSKALKENTSLTFDLEETNKKIKEKIYSENETKGNYKFHFDATAEKFKTFRFAKDNFSASLISKGQIFSYNQKEKGKFLHKFREELQGREEPSTVIAFDVDKKSLSPELLKTLLKETKLKEAFITIDRIKDNPEKKRLFIGSLNKLSDKEVSTIVKKANQKLKLDNEKGKFL